LISLTVVMVLLRAEPARPALPKDCTLTSEGSHRAELRCPDRAIAEAEMGPPWSSPSEFLELFAHRTEENLTPREFGVGDQRRPGFYSGASMGRERLFVAPDPKRPLAIRCFKTARVPIESVCTDVIEFLSTIDLRALPQRDVPVLVFTKRFAAGELVTGAGHVEKLVPAALAVGAARSNYAHLLEDVTLKEPVEAGDPVLNGQFGWAKLLTPFQPNECAAPESKATLTRPATKQAGSRPKIRSIVIAARYLKAGETLSRANLAITEVPSDRVSRSFVGLEDIDAVVNQKALLPISTGEPLRFSALAGFPGARDHCAPPPAKK
jgi:hypothetical protein